MTSVGVIVIGRNEGVRLHRCLDSLPLASHIVYVDSGSIDGSASYASQTGADVIELDMRLSFTAARGRNAGILQLRSDKSPPQYIQTIDGDCILDANWIATAVAALEKNPDLACVFGRRREIHPDHSIFNRLCDAEWNVPIGFIESCGGDALFRTSALASVDGYRDSLIAGEEPDLCLRMRQKGWLIERIPDEMTRHDVAITRIDQWWLRAVRAGHAYAEHVWIHRQDAFASWKVQLMRIAVWGMMLPFVFAGSALAALLGSGAGQIILVIIVSLYVFQFSRLSLRNRKNGFSLPDCFKVAGLTLLGKLAEAQGVLRFTSRKIFGKTPRIIEYKSTPTA